MERDTAGRAASRAQIRGGPCRDRHGSRDGRHDGGYHFGILGASPDDCPDPDDAPARLVRGLCRYPGWGCRRASILGDTPRFPIDPRPVCPYRVRREVERQCLNLT